MHESSIIHGHHKKCFIPSAFFFWGTSILHFQVPNNKPKQILPSGRVLWNQAINLISTIWHKCQMGPGEASYENEWNVIKKMFNHHSHENVCSLFLLYLQWPIDALYTNMDSNSLRYTCVLPLCKTVTYLTSKSFKVRKGTGMTKKFVNLGFLIPTEHNKYKNEFFSKRFFQQGYIL